MSGEAAITPVSIAEYAASVAGTRPWRSSPDSHPIAHPPHTNRNVCREAASPAVETTAKITAQTIAQAML
ncbi:hypothetical protein [Mycobacterium colombiense]|uniref:hypothetical protein n=1 Tax=Mycobacterium colombiense TaxID=339268 RepID=UPI0012DB2745|nr:hypothetical protein [Mycobacterium colombiense]